jgi:selenocysteine-specific elongation factor
MAAKEPQVSMAGTAVRHFILGTAGHIDHGKTSLVRALTGIDTDRLPEEQRRGMTIELGFADLAIDDCRFGIVDVPGHERFVRTMVAGATGIDLALLVVAADDSVMPQTREHVEILNLLGVRRGVAAITKCDVIDGEMLELVTDDVRQLLSTTPLSDVPICPVSSVSGAGLDALKTAIVEAAGRACSDVHAGGTSQHATRTGEGSFAGKERSAGDARAPFRMAIDRVFTVQGRGTVVTGSVLSGKVTEGESLEVLPISAMCRVRGLQTHGEQAALIARGQRAAINLSGIERDRLAKGMELATPGYMTPTRMMDVKLTCLASYSKGLKSATTVRLEIGTAEIPARVVLLNGGHMPPGQSDFAQLRCGESLTAAYGQRFIIRDENAVRTIGGGVVLRPVAQRRRRSAEGERESLARLEAGDAATRLEEALTQARFAMPSTLTLVGRTGVALEALPTVMEELRQTKRLAAIGDTAQFVTSGAVGELGERLAGWLLRFHRANPELPGRPMDAVLGWLERMTNRTLARPLMDRLEAEGVFKRLGRFACAPAFAPSLSAADEKFLSSMIEEIRAGGFQPPGLSELSIAGKADRKRLARLATLAAALGEIVSIDAGTFLHFEAEQALRARVSGLIRDRGKVTVADVREALVSSRKFVVPFLEYLDRVGLTRREGDFRVLAEGHMEKGE